MREWRSGWRWDCQEGEIAKMGKVGRPTHLTSEPLFSLSFIPANRSISDKVSCEICLARVYLNTYLLVVPCDFIPLSSCLLSLDASHLLLFVPPNKVMCLLNSFSLTTVHHYSLQIIESAGSGCKVQVSR